MLGAIEVLQPVFTEIGERYVCRQLAGDQFARRARDEDLPAVAGGADPCCAVHVQADVVIMRDRGLAGVDAHADPHIHALEPGPRSERPLVRDRGGNRVACPREGDENASPLV